MRIIKCLKQFLTRSINCMLNEMRPDCNKETLEDYEEILSSFNNDGRGYPCTLWRDTEILSSFNNDNRDCPYTLWGDIIKL